jgi:hypothetical protein
MTREPGSAMSIDHVLFATADFHATAKRLMKEHGLAAVEGGRHVGWGTANWIVPLGSSYVEITGIWDPEAAAKVPFGRRLGEVLDHGGGLYAWCVVPGDFDATVRRLGLDPSIGSRQRPDGSAGSGRVAGLEVAMRDSSRPFFLEWTMPPVLHPGAEVVPHRVRPRGFAWVEVAGDERIVRDWLGDERLPVRVRPGAPALLTVGIATAEGEIVLP